MVVFHESWKMQNKDNRQKLKIILGWIDGGRIERQREIETKRKLSIIFLISLYRKDWEDIETTNQEEDAMDKVQLLKKILEIQKLLNNRSQELLLFLLSVSIPFDFLNHEH